MRTAEGDTPDMSMFEVSRSTVEIGGTEISFETGHLARRASGAVVVRAGETMVLCTATAGNDRDVDFLPLTVDVEERHYAAGKIPGSCFRRQGRAGEKATRTARTVERAARPRWTGGREGDADRADHRPAGAPAVPEGLALRHPGRLSADVGRPRPPLRHP